MKDLVTNSFIPNLLTLEPCSPSEAYLPLPSPPFRGNIPYPVVSEIVLSNSPSAGCLSLALGLPPCLALADGHLCWFH